VSFEEPDRAGHDSGFNGAVSPEKSLMVVYRISDTGMGIRAESLPHLFDAFTREDTDKIKYIEGTGLGLSIVKQLTDLMGGRIEVESEYGSGSAFTVRLKQSVADSAPLGSFDPDEALSTRERPVYKPGFVAPDVCVLIVDDNKFNLLVETRLLQATKVQITTALSGAECLKLTAEKKYDVIFMDHMMPEMDGIECLHAIREQEGGLNNQTPVIILTANSGQENRELYEREGFDDFLLKPVKGAELEGALIRTLS
ncbi:MAG: response regulator, partial [Lachnospiraceae bacterium]|nr:response regulator [Lachnospiraceae bacterium]